MANDPAHHHGHRKFYDFEGFDEHTRKLLQSTEPATGSQDFQKLIEYIRKNIIGSDYVFQSPFALTKVLYADYIASGKTLKFVEDYIEKEVLPAYANTHTTTSITGLQSTLFRHEARSIIRDCTNASEHDAVIFAGTGCTGAVHLLINALALGKNPLNLPIVIAGPYDHHATLLPWRELTNDVYQIGLTKEGLFNMDDFEQLLQRFAGSKRTLIGCMAAASNITGHTLPVDHITVCLHKAGALAFWDFAMSAPYVELDMNPYSSSDDPQYVYKDAMFMSPHKFIGGPGSPGILIAKKKLFNNPVPANCGGGTVFYVRREHHIYLKEIESREEGGTPDIVGSIRAGMVFQLKRAVGIPNIEARELELFRKASKAWLDIPGLFILGSPAERLPVFSMVFQLGNKLLHHNYAAALLNDLFGIQSRGGCACAGPYAQELLGIDETLAKRFENILMEDSRLDRVHLRRVEEHSDKEVLRPGFVRLNLAYFMSEEQVDFIIEAVKMVATDGWKLLPRYLFNPTTGEWKMRHHEQFADRKWLGAISYSEGKMTYPAIRSETPVVADYTDMLERANNLFAAAAKSARFGFDQKVMFADTDLLWFVLPSEGSDLLAGKVQLPLLSKPVFSPTTYFVGATDASPPDHNGVIDSSPAPPADHQPLPQAAAAPSDAAPSDAAPSAPKWKKVPKMLMNPIIKAIDDFAMINDGDKILICLSGGKDSLSLLHAMKQYQYIAKSKDIVFTLAAATVDPGSTAYDPRPLIQYLAKLELPYFYEQQGIMQKAGSLEGGCDSICSFCSRMKRGRLYRCAREQGYNVLAMGQHLDDLAESFMMSTFHNGLLRTMKANYTVSEGDLRVIRPLVYVRERALRDFAESQKLPVISENCPACFEQPKERHRIKQLLASQEILFPELYKSLLSSLRPLMAIGSSEMTLFKTILDPRNVNSRLSKNNDNFED